MKKYSLIFVLFFFLTAGTATLYCQWANPPQGTVVRTIVCKADNIFAPTGLMIVKNQPVKITASGAWGTTPMSTDCGPEGYPAGTNPRMQLLVRFYQGGSSVFQNIIGSSWQGKGIYNGELRFGHDKSFGLRWGEMTITITLEPAPITVDLPGTRGSPSGGGIGGPPLGKVNEDTVGNLWGIGETTVTIATGTRIKYEFEFKDKYDTAPFIRTFDPFNPPGQDIIGQFKASHKFKESGIYPITLKTTYTDAEDDTEKHLYAGPFQLIVVDHLPEFIGAVVPMIRGPGKIVEGPLSDKNITVNNPAGTDIIMEDVIETPNGAKANFKLFGLFKLYAELPEGIDTGTDADRFKGVIPDSVKFRVEWGDGVVSGWKPFTSVNTASPSSGNDFNVSKPFLSPAFNHEYAQPGTYTMKVTLGYKCVEYLPVSKNGIVYTYKKKPNPATLYTSKNRTIIVSDETPPRIPDSEIRKLYATTGDPLNVEFSVGDNHPDKELTSQRLYLEKSPKSSQYQEIELEMENAGPSALCGNSYRVFTEEWIMPLNLAVKKADPTKFLRYYLKLTDGENNLNKGLTNIKEDDPPSYLSGGFNDRKYGQMFLTDNDPPGIEFTVEVRNNIMAAYSVTEQINDFKDGPGIYGKMVICDKQTGACQQVSDFATNAYNPATTPWGVPPAYFKEVTIPEKTRLIVKVKTSDNVDGEANRIVMGLSGNTRTFDGGSANFSMVVSEIGEHEFVIRAEDKINLNGKLSYRLISFKLKVLDSNVYVKTIGGDG